MPPERKPSIHLSRGVSLLMGDMPDGSGGRLAETNDSIDLRYASSQLAFMAKVRSIAVPKRIWLA